MLQSSRAIFSNSFDWRHTKMAVSPVKDQGKCGSCWAFAATGALESHIYIKTKRSLLLSEQNLVDCTLNNTKNFGIYRSYGCGGGMTSRAFNYIRVGLILNDNTRLKLPSFQDNNGINTEQSYPYQAADLKCRHNVTNDDAKSNQGYLGIFPDETLIKLIVTNIGPVAVAMHVSKKFIHYQSGIYTEPNCPRTINHAVLIVGYGTENGQDFWIVKNSWGSAWGEDGYFRILRGANHCGIALYATYPLV
jgi:cathepsin L